MFKRDVAYSIDWERVRADNMSRCEISAHDWDNEFKSLPDIFKVREFDRVGLVSIYDENGNIYSSNLLYILVHEYNASMAINMSEQGYVWVDKRNPKLRKHHVDWLNRNDGLYEVRPDNSFWTDSNNERVQNKILFVFKSTQFSFNQYGLSEAIDKAIELYPDS